MQEVTIKWVLFAAIFAMVPVLWYFAVAIFILPIGPILIGLLTKSPSPWGFALLIAVHCLVYGAIFYLAAKFIAKGLSRASTVNRNVWVAGILAGMLALGSLPIYGGGGHGSSEWGSAYKFYKSWVF